MRRAVVRRRARTSVQLVRALAWAVVVAVILAVPAPLLAPRAQQSTGAQIVSPQAGQTLVGNVNIIGAASDPDFQRYRLEFASMDAAEEQWLLIAEITQQATAGVLAQWDTTQVPDGRYQIRLRVILRDGTVVQAAVQNLLVQNQQPTPLPTLAGPPTLGAPTATPTEGPTPTGVIQQPPTSAPPATFAPPSAAPPPADITQVLGAAQSAFCTGIFVALVGFALLGGYRVFYVRLRPRLRRALAEMQADE
ncbi:MAG: hypothetical protein IT323_06770 [Anaerolineae bacterium]|nr:hypothetical protein [Anaerolineae bacterium]